MASREHKILIELPERIFDCEVSPSQVHQGDVKQFLSRNGVIWGTKKCIIPILSTYAEEAGREDRRRTDRQRAEVFLMVGMFALKGPFKSIRCQGRFSFQFF